MGRRADGIPAHNPGAAPPPLGTERGSTRGGMSVYRLSPKVPPILGTQKDRKGAGMPLYKLSPGVYAVEMSVGGVKVKARLDPGARISVMSKECYGRLSEQPRAKEMVRLKLAESKEGFLGTLMDPIWMELGDIEIKQSVCVAPITDDFLLGLDLLKHWRAMVDVGTDTLVIGDNRIPMEISVEGPSMAQVMLAKQPEMSGSDHFQQVCDTLTLELSPDQKGRAEALLGEYKDMFAGSECSTPNRRRGKRSRKRNRRKKYRQWLVPGREYRVHKDKVPGEYERKLEVEMVQSRVEALQEIRAFLGQREQGLQSLAKRVHRVGTCATCSKKGTWPTGLGLVAPPGEVMTAAGIHPLALGEVGEAGGGVEAASGVNQSSRSKG